MKRVGLTLLAAALLFALTACDGIFDGDYLSVTVHDEDYTIDEGSDALTAENFLSLKNAILSFVENHVEYGVIRVYQYDGDLEDDLSNAAYEVAKSDPLGAYAVDYMTHDCTKIVSYYEIHIYITFARTQAEIQAVERVNGTAALREAVVQALLNGDEACALRVSSYAEVDYSALLEECYTENPAAFSELPTISVELYPKTGVQRILNFNFTYTRDGETRENEREQLVQTAQRLVLGLSTMDETEAFSQLSKRLIALGGEAQLDEQALVYDTLCGASVSSQSLSLALKYLMDLAGIDCMCVSGRYNNVPYSWNIVALEGDYFHVDLLRDIGSGYESARLSSDAAMELEYTWDVAAYPACESQPEQTSDEKIHPIPELPDEPADPEPVTTEPGESEAETEIETEEP